MHAYLYAESMGSLLVVVMKASALTAPSTAIDLRKYLGSRVGTRVESAHPLAFLASQCEDSHCQSSV